MLRREPLEEPEWIHPLECWHLDAHGRCPFTNEACPDEYGLKCDDYCDPREVKEA